MEKINTSVLILGENIYSTLLATLLKRAGLDLLILRENRASMLSNPIIRYHKSEAMEGDDPVEIKGYLKRLGLEYREDLSPFEALFTTSDRIMCTAILKTYNYYEYANKTKAKMIFVEFENIQQTHRIIPGEGYEIVRIKVFDRERLYTLYEIASLLDSELEPQIDLGRRIKERISAGNRIIILPPALGVLKHQSITSNLQNLLGCDIYEALTLTPQVVNMRFYKALCDLRRDEGIEVIEDRIKGFSATDKKINEIETENYIIYPKIVVLITERFIEGGLKIEKGRVLEPVLRIPVYFEKCKNELSYFAEEDLFGRHNIFECGIRTDENFTPLDLYGNTLFNNLFAAGSIVYKSQDVLSNLLKIIKLTGVIKWRLFLDR